MQLHIIDISIILLYLVSVVIVGFWIQKKASHDLASYFLGGRTIPWYVLGVSNASSMFDVTGTMWLVSIIFIYGMKGAWLPWLWPTFNQIFLMIYLAIWIRRSNVVTGAEWITTRFGSKRGAELSRLSVVVFALITTIGFLSYAYQGVGRFASVILPWDFSAQTYGVILMVITTLYVIVGGMYSVVLTDVIQFIMLTIASFILGYLAFTMVSVEQLQAAVPAGWFDLFFAWKLNIDWGNLIPEINNRIAADGYGLFTIVFMMILFKGILNSLAGPTPNYDMQRILATRNNKDAALMSGMVSVALFPRWLMITGITVLGLVYFSPDLLAMGDSLDLELIMPYVVKNFLPVGAVGLIIAGLLASFMSTFDSTVNSGAAYIVNDLYLRYIRPDADQKLVIRWSYVASFLLVLLGIAFGLMSESIHTVMQFIVSGLYGGFTAPNILKWHWWRFNGYGYFWGMVSGLASALLVSMLLPELQLLYAFTLILAISLIFSIAASLMTEADGEDVLKEFYKNVRPWGAWKKIHDLVLLDDPEFINKSSWKRDSLNIINGIIWQLSLVLMPIYLVIKKFDNFTIALVIMVITSVLLKKFWYNKIEE